MGRSYFHLHLVSDSTGRDVDSGFARGGSAIPRRRLDRACLSAGAHDQPTRPRHRRDRGCARHRAVHPCRSRAVAPAGDELRSQRFAVPFGAGADPDPVPVLSRPERDLARRRAAHAQRRLFQAHRRLELHDDERRRPDAGKSGPCRYRAGRRQPHLEDADEHLSRQSRLQDRQRAVRARRAAAARLGRTEAAARRWPHRFARAHHPDPAEPTALAQRRHQQRIYRPRRRRRGDSPPPAAFWPSAAGR